MKKIFCFIFFLFSVPNALPAAPTPKEASASALTYSDAFSMLWSRDENIRAAREDVARRRNERNAARSLYLPSVDLSASYNRINDPLVIDLDPIRQAMAKLHHIPASYLPPFTETVQEQEFGKVSATASLPLFTGFRRPAANSAASSRLKDAEAQELQTQGESVATLTERYFGLRLASDVATVRREVLEAMEEHQRQALKLRDAGVLSKSDALHAEVALADAKMEYQSSLSDVEIARTALHSLLPDAKNSEPATPLFVLKNLDPLESFLREGALDNPLLARVRAQRSLAGAQVSAQRGRLLPNVYAFGKYELYKDDLTLLEPEWVVGVAASLNVFDGLQRAQDLQAARHQKRAVDLLNEKAERDIRLLVTKGYLELQKARDRHQALTASLALAEENVRSREKGFREGLATSLDVVDARLSLAKVRTEQLKACYDYELALARLLEASGHPEKMKTYVAQADKAVH